MKTGKSVQLSLILTDISMILLVVAAIALPGVVSWYVEIKNRSATLPATIMVTCYPCAPFTAVALFSLRRILKNVLKDLIFVENNVMQFKRIAFCSIVIAVVTLIAGRYYLPFYIVGATFAFLSLLSYSMQGIFSSVIKKDNSEATKSSPEEDKSEGND